jgi:hypothetical protein
MPAVSKAQRGFIAANPEKFGGLKNALEEWIKPTKGQNLPEHVKKPKGKKK